MELWKKGRADVKHSPGPLVQAVSTVSRLEKALPFQSLHEILLCFGRKEEGNGKFCFPQLSLAPVLQHGYLGVQGEPQQVWTQAGPCRVPAAVTSALWRHVTRTSLKKPLATSPSNLQRQAPGSLEEENPVSSPETSQAEGGIDLCIQVCRRQRVSISSGARAGLRGGGT